MTTYKPGAILLVAFPFTDFSSLKQRPCVVVSSTGFNRTHRDVILAAITSQLSIHPATDEHLLSTNDLRAGGLPKASLVKLGKIVTIDQRLVRKSLGTLSFTTTTVLLTKLRTIFV